MYLFTLKNSQTSRIVSSGDESEPTENSDVVANSSTITSVITIADDDNITDRNLPETDSEQVNR